MFITVTLPNGPGYLRADRIQAVINSEFEDGKTKAFIEMFSGADETGGEGFYVMEEPAFIMDKINSELRKQGHRV